MNKQLTQEIINHIFSGFSILKSEDFNYKKYKSLKSSDYLLSDKISLQDDDGNTINNSIWGIQFAIEDHYLRILLANCSLDKTVAEYAMLIKLKDSPSYGLYSAYSLDKDFKVDNCPLIAVSVDNQNWMKCNTYLQATFLAGMENAKDASYAITNCTDYQSEYNCLLSFIKFHNKIYGEDE